MSAGEIDRARVQELLAAGAQLVEVLPAEEYEDEHLPRAITWADEDFRCVSSVATAAIVEGSCDNLGGLPEGQADSGQYASKAQNALTCHRLAKKSDAEANRHHGVESDEHRDAGRSREFQCPYQQEA